MGKAGETPPFFCLPESTGQRRPQIEERHKQNSRRFPSPPASGQKRNGLDMGGLGKHIERLHNFQAISAVQ